MIQIQVNLSLPEGKFNAFVQRCVYAQDVQKNQNLIPTNFLLPRIYNSWINLCQDLATIGSRGVNIPEGLTEGLYCYISGAYRTNNLGINGVNTSFDCYLPPNLFGQQGTRVQVKACSVYPDLTSFGPHSVWDELIFIDFSSKDGNFYIYVIPNGLVESQVLNQKTGETFIQQQMQGRRPRLSLAKLIQKNNIPATYTGNIYNL